MIGFNNGTFQEVTEINIPITSLSINRGFGAFEFFEVINCRPFFGERHFQRLQHSVKILRLKNSFVSQIDRLVDELIARNSVTNIFIKIFVLPHSVGDTEAYESGLYIFPVHMPEYPAEWYTNGARLIVKNYQRFLPEAKSTNYLSGQYWQYECDEANAVDVLYSDGNTLQETSRGNIFMVKDGVISTPNKNILKGITRSVVIDIINSQKWLFVEKDISVNELFAADEVFVTSTTKKIVPVVMIDGISINKGLVGEKSDKIMKLFKEMKSKY